MNAPDRIVGAESTHTPNTLQEVKDDGAERVAIDVKELSVFEAQPSWDPGLVYRLSPAPTKPEIEALMCRAYEAGVSDIHLVSDGHVFFDRYARLDRATAVELGSLNSILSYLTESASVLGQLAGAQDVNRAVEVRPQGHRNRRYRFRLNAVKCRAGATQDAVQITLRSIPQTPVELSTLGLQQSIFENIFPENGMILVVGVTGSGKTTLLFSVLRHIAEKMKDRKIITHEDPVEFTFAGINCAGMIPTQVEIGNDLPDFESCIAAAMRRKASVILIGECRKRTEFGALVDAALSGHATYSTLHAGSVQETINRILNMFPFDEQPSLASKLLGSLKMIVVQKLVKTVDGKRRPLREWLVFDKQTVEHLSDIPFTDWNRELRRMVAAKGQSLQDAADALYREGLLSAEVYLESMGVKPPALDAKVGLDLLGSDEDLYVDSEEDF